MTAADLRLLIVGTPKTGNTWLRFLLSGVYRLPMQDVPKDFTEEEFTRLPRRWVGQQHLLPTAELLAWADRERAVFLTTFRHPGDALVSLYHYVRSYENDPRWKGERPAILSLDRGGPGENVTAYVRDGFTRYLEQSAIWAATGRSIVVRYEDLCRDPEDALERAVRAIHEKRPDAGLPLDRIAGSVAACELRTLRQGLGLDPAFFRKGGSGSWVDELPPAVHEMFRSLDPYPRLFAALGYSPDPARAERLAPRAAASVPNPFENAELFEDGAAVRPFLVRLFLSLDDATRRSLHPLAPLSDSASFQAWLFRPAADDPRPGTTPPVTNLAAAIHAVRPDLQRAFPEPFDADRQRFSEWFHANAAREYALDARLFGEVPA